MGDVELFDHFLDDNLGAAAIAGVEVDHPSETWLDVEVPAITQELSVATGGVPGVTASWAAGDERGAIYDAAWDYWHVLASPTGDFFFNLGAGDGTIANRSGIVSDNADTDYATYGEQFAFLNDDIERVEGSNRVRRSQGQKPAPLISGNPSIPVLSIHAIGDLFVPIEMQLIYADRVEANGRSDLLVQRGIRDVGHCTFSGSEWVQSYTDLFAWVESGHAPEGEDLRADIGDPLWSLTGAAARSTAGCREVRCGCLTMLGAGRAPAVVATHPACGRFIASHVVSRGDGSGHAQDGSTSPGSVVAVAVGAGR